MRRSTPERFNGSAALPRARAPLRWLSAIHHAARTEIARNALAALQAGGVSARCQKRWTAVRLRDSLGFVKLVDQSPPACCACCSDFGAAEGKCQLLAHPTPANRVLLLQRACGVRAILESRFGSDRAHDAIENWLTMKKEPAAIATSFGGAPLDQRLWLTRWPFWNIVPADRPDRVIFEETPERRSSEADQDQEVIVDWSRALDLLRDISQDDFEMMLDMIRGEFDPRPWLERLKCSESTLMNRKWLASYRLVVLRHGLLTRIYPAPAAVVLRARQFTAGVTDEAAAQAHCGEPLPSFRRLYQLGVSVSLALLGAPDALGPDRMQDLVAPFRRALGVAPPLLGIGSDGGRGGRSFVSSAGRSFHQEGTNHMGAKDVVEETIRALIVATEPDSPSSAGEEHFDDDIWRLYAARALPPQLAALAVRHLMTCKDGSCVGSYRKWFRELRRS